jgi:hypothetical protein
MMESPGQTQSMRLSIVGVLNLLVPGLGIIWHGRIAGGLALGVVFAACANLAVCSVLLIPDDLPGWAPPLAIGLAAGAYVGCQVQFVRSARQHRNAERERIRRVALSTVRESLEQGDYAGGLAALAPISHLAAHDLLVAYRTAQVLSGLGDAQAARTAWQQVRALDRHHIYRDEWRTAAAWALHSSDAGGEVPPDRSLV